MGSPGSSDAHEGARAFFIVRVFVLLGILAIVLLYAWHDIARRRSRLTWDRTLDVALVVVRAGAVDDGAVDALRSRLPELEAELEGQLGRYRADALAPFRFELYGPVDGAEPPPPPSDPGIVASLGYAWTAWRYRAGIDRAVEIPSRGYDARLYVVVVPLDDSNQRFVEGFGEHGGRVGYVRVELDDTMIEPALFVVTHELFHTLGAEDRYDSQGHTLVPEGLVDPTQRPLYPQRRADVMARGLLVSPTEERLPETLDEVGVGATTARELRWIE